jgi:putative nucleotidyltransferase with HDIG domain
VPVGHIGPNSEISQALAQLHEWIQNPNLRKHCCAVEAAMRHHARLLGADEERWGLAGLIHDFDWERHPDAVRHPVEGVKVLRGLGWPEDICQAVLGHATHTGVPRATPMAQVLYACDELCGFLVACALVRPSRSLADLEVSSVKKKLKDKAFARGVDRDEVRRGAEELGVPLDDHIRFVIEALRPVERDLGLGQPG